MIWQDIVLMLTGFGFSLVLIPSIRSKVSKPPRSSCFLTASFLIVNVFALSFLHLWLAAASTVLALVAWTILLFQRR